MSNNPFIPYLTEEENKKNDNDDQNKDNNDKPTNNNDIAKILEEGTASAAPPPAYEDIVKPPPTQPGYTYQSYAPPPPFPPPAIEDYNQSPNVYRVPTNSNENRGGRRVCCSGNSRRNKSCSCGWIIVLLIFVVFGMISAVNNNVCNNINLGGDPSEVYSFDPAGTTLRINVDEARIKRGDVMIFSKPPANGTQIDISVLSGSVGITPKFVTSNQNGFFELKIIQKGFSLFNIPPRCMKTQINVYLPDNTNSIAPVPNAIQVRDLDITMNANGIPYKQNITLFTDDGDIHLKGINAQSIFIRTDDGDIDGTIQSLSNELFILTDDGNVDLSLGTQNANPKVSVTTNDGDVSLGFAGSFSGNYNIRSNDGRIQVDNNFDRNQITGTVGNGGTGNLAVITDDGDVRVLF